MKIIFQLLVALWISGAAADPATDLWRAVGIDNDRAVRQLLAAGLDPNTPLDKGQRGLVLALRDESYKVAAVLIAHPAIRIDEPNASDETALMMAALRGNADWVRQLLDRGAAVRRPGWSPLHYAATGAPPAVAELLLARGADIEARSPNGSTPLMMAARYGSEAMVDLLLSRGADRAATNERGMNAEAFAQSAGREALARRLSPTSR